MADPRPVTSVASTVDALRGEVPTPHGAGWDFDGFRVWVESNEPALIAELADYFAGFRTIDARTPGVTPVTRITAIQIDPPHAPPDFGAGAEMTTGEYKPSVKGPKEAFLDLDDGRVVHKLRTGMWFLFGSDHHLAIGPCTDNPNQVVNFVNNRMIQWSLHRGALLGHASAVAYRPGRDPAQPARTVAIAGFSGMGKSTLALDMLNDRRLDFLSNDRVMIQPRRDGRQIVEGVPKHPRINPGTILHNAALGPVLTAEERRRFLALPTDDLWQLEHKFDGLIGRCFPGQAFLLAGEFVGLVLLNWRRGAGPTVATRIDVDARRELLPALMKAPGVFYRPDVGEVASRDADRYVEFLAGIDVVELSGGIDFDRGRSAALELLGL